MGMPPIKLWEFKAMSVFKDFLNTAVEDTEKEKELCKLYLSVSDKPQCINCGDEIEDLGEFITLRMGRCSVCQN